MLLPPWVDAGERVSDEGGQLLPATIDADGCSQPFGRRRLGRAAASFIGGAHYGRMTKGSGFYHLDDVVMSDQRCQGTACFVARRRDPVPWAGASVGEPRVYCVGRCFTAPARADDLSRPHVAVDAPEAVVCDSAGSPAAAVCGWYAARRVPKVRLLTHGARLDMRRRETNEPRPPPPTIPGTGSSAQ